jgi:hypothetical protein
MTENQPPSNARNATVDMAEGRTIEHANLRDVKEHRVSVTGSKATEIRKLEVLLADERKRSKSAFKDLALAESKPKKLLDLLDSRELKVVQLRAGNTGAFTKVNLLKTHIMVAQHLDVPHYQATDLQIKASTFPSFVFYHGYKEEPDLSPPLNYQLPWAWPSFLIVEADTISLAKFV